MIKLISFDPGHAIPDEEAGRDLNISSRPAIPMPGVVEAPPASNCQLRFGRTRAFVCGTEEPMIGSNGSRTDGTVVITSARRGIGKAIARATVLWEQEFAEADQAA